MGHMTDKVWFPRSILVLVPCLSNLFTLATTMVILLVAMPDRRRRRTPGAC